MRKLRVLHLIKSLNRGGAETLLAEGLRFAERAQFELSYGYFNPDLDALVPTLRAEGACVTCFGGSNHMTMLGRMARVVRHLRDHRIDLMHCHLPTAAVVGRLAGRLADVPVVYTEHNKPEWYRRPTFLLNAWTYRFQEQVIAVSSSVEDSIRSYIRPHVPVAVVRNGIDSGHFRRVLRDGDLVRKMLGLAPDHVVIGNIAALIPQKCLHDWVTAARLIHDRCPESRFLLVGDGPLRSEVLRRVAAQGLQDVVFLCGVHADVRPYLSAMNIYMMSSAYEGLPVALLEAMAMNVVPVCTAVGGIVEVIRDGENGFLTEFGRPDQLANRVVELTGQPIRHRTIAVAARHTVVETFRIEAMVRTVEAVYRDVLGRRQPGPRVRASRDVARVS